MLEKYGALIERITALAASGNRAVVAIDGCCASGKTTLAAALGDSLDCKVFHMDDFFLREEQRTPERLAEPSGNVDYERFLSEVLIPVKKGIQVLYRKYDCHNRTLTEPIPISPAAVNIVEGAYSCHPALWDYYDLRVFLSLSPKEQMSRILKRNGAAEAEVFRNKWIVLEKLYFDTFRIKERCDFLYE